MPIEHSKLDAAGARELQRSLEGFRAEFEALLEARKRTRRSGRQLLEFILRLEGLDPAEAAAPPPAQSGEPAEAPGPDDASTARLAGATGPAEGPQLAALPRAAAESAEAPQPVAFPRTVGITGVGRLGEDSPLRRGRRGECAFLEELGGEEVLRDLIVEFAARQGKATSLSRGFGLGLGLGVPTLIRREAVQELWVDQVGKETASVTCLFLIGAETSSSRLDSRQFELVRQGEQWTVQCMREPEVKTLSDECEMSITGCVSPQTPPRLASGSGSPMLPVAAADFEEPGAPSVATVTTAKSSLKRPPPPLEQLCEELEGGAEELPRAAEGKEADAGGLDEALRFGLAVSEAARTPRVVFDKFATGKVISRVSFASLVANYGGRSPALEGDMEPAGDLFDQLAVPTSYTCGRDSGIPYELFCSELCPEAEPDTVKHVSSMRDSLLKTLRRTASQLGQGPPRVARVRSTGRLGAILESDPTDAAMTHRLSFSDGSTDWFAEGQAEAVTTAEDVVRDCCGSYPLQEADFWDLVWSMLGALSDGPPDPVAVKALWRDLTQGVQPRRLERAALVQLLGEGESAPPAADAGKPAQDGGLSAETLEVEARAREAEALADRYARERPQRKAAERAAAAVEGGPRQPPEDVGWLVESLRSGLALSASAGTPKAVFETFATASGQGALISRASFAKLAATYGGQGVTLEGDRGPGGLFDQLAVPTSVTGETEWGIPYELFCSELCPEGEPDVVVSVRSKSGALLKDLRRAASGLGHGKPRLASVPLRSAQRLGSILEHDPTDAALTYKLRFSDGSTDWFAEGQAEAVTTTEDVLRSNCGSYPLEEADFWEVVRNLFSALSDGPPDPVAVKVLWRELTQGVQPRVLGRISFLQLLSEGESTPPAADAGKPEQDGGLSAETLEVEARAREAEALADRYVRERAQRKAAERAAAAVEGGPRQPPEDMGRLVESPRSGLALSASAGTPKAVFETFGIASGQGALISRVSHHSPGSPGSPATPTAPGSPAPPTAPPALETPPAPGRGTERPTIDVVEDMDVSLHSGMSASVIIDDTATPLATFGLRVEDLVAGTPQTPPAAAAPPLRKLEGMSPLHRPKDLAAVFQDADADGDGVLGLADLRKYLGDFLGYGDAEIVAFHQAQGGASGVTLEAFKKGIRGDLSPYAMSKRRDCMLVRKPGAFGGMSGVDFQVEECSGCTILICDPTAQVYLDELLDCLVLVGPCNSSIFARNCRGCKFWLACRQLRTRDCASCTFHLHSHTEPVIESSSDLSFAPFAAEYPGLSAQFQQAGFDSGRNFWTAIFDFTGRGDGANWSILPLDECEKLVATFERCADRPDGPAPELTHQLLTAPPPAAGEGHGDSLVKIPQTRPPAPPLPTRCGPRRRLVSDGGDAGRRGTVEPAAELPAPPGGLAATAEEAEEEEEV